MRKRILYCVLNWGLGHATRSIPIISELLDHECDVILASDGMALNFLRSQFPSLRFCELARYNVKYDSNTLALNVLLNWQNIRSAIKAERGITSSVVLKENIDVIITDNRYGCFVPGIPSVIITHQLQFQTGNWVQDLAGKMILKKLLAPFDHIWIPDDEEHSLSGDLSTTNDSRARYIGLQSTLTRITENEEFAIAAIISGPEPLRTAFEEEIRKEFEELKLNCALVRGVQGSDAAREEGSITVYDYLNRNGINRLMNSSKIILCRSGYSSLMDLEVLGKNAILVPTPGQPEQMSLARRMKLRPKYKIQEQGKLNIKSAIEALKNQPSDPSNLVDPSLLRKAIKELFSLY